MLRYVRGKRNEPIGEINAPVPRTSEAVVIGGGIHRLLGCLPTGEAGRRRDARGAGAYLAWGASGRNGGHVSPTEGYTAQFLPFTTANFSLLARMGNEHGADFEFRLSDGMELVTEAAALPKLGATTCACSGGLPRDGSDGRGGAGARPCDRSAVIAARCTEESTDLNPILLAHAFARAATRHGARIVTGARVAAIEVDARGVAAVVTTVGRIATRTVVNAANGWAAQIGAHIGLALSPCSRSAGRFSPPCPCRHCSPVSSGTRR